MPIYHCKTCDYQTTRQQNFQRHLQSKRHLKESTESQHLVNQKSTFSQPKVNLFDEKTISPFQCHYCGKFFKFKQSKYKHIKYTCKQNKDEDLKELARLLNEKNDQLEKTTKQMETMQRQIDKLTNKLQIQNVVHGNVNQSSNIYNIQLLNHSETDYSHLTERDYVRCIHNCNHCVKSLIEKVHFNTKKPENMNIYISNIKGQYAMIYKANKWQIVNKKTQIDDLYDYNEVILENWYEEYKQKYPEIIKSFKRYLKNKEGNDVIDQVKVKILMMLYNNRNMIQTHDTLPTTLQVEEL